MRHAYQVLQMMAKQPAAIQWLRKLAFTRASVLHISDMQAKSAFKSSIFLMRNASCCQEAARARNCLCGFENH